MTGESANGLAIAKCSYTHDAMIDLLIARPEVSQGEVAEHFGYTAPWVSRVIRSDAFREQLARRKGEIVDPMLLQAVEQRFEILVEQALLIIQEQLKTTPTFEKALKAADLGVRALGYGAKSANVQVHNQFVVAMPEKARDSSSWLAGRVVPAES